MSHRTGLPAIIDPASGRLVITEAAPAIVELSTAAGLHQLTATIEEPEHPTWITVRVDGAERPTYLATSMWDARGRKSARDFRYQFFAATDGPRQIEIRVQRPDGGAATLILNSLAAEPWQAPDPTPALASAPLVDVWGFQSPISYQRRTGRAGGWRVMVGSIDLEACHDDRMASFEDLSAAMSEAARHGANYVQFYPHLMRWRERLSDWAAGEDVEIVRRAHRLGMIVDDHHEPEQAVANLDAELALVARWAVDHADAGIDPDGALDGFEGEIWTFMNYKESMSAALQEIWARNPGAYVCQMGTEWMSIEFDRGRPAPPWSPGAGGRVTASIRVPTSRAMPWQRSKGPMFIKGIMAATELTPPNTPYGPFWTGRDDHIPMTWDPDGADLTADDADHFLLYQADCRAASPNEYGGGSLPDWIVKQVNDFVRPRYGEPSRVAASGLIWISEAADVCPPSVKRYVFAACQNPIRGAFAMTLAATGRGGTLARKTTSAISAMADPGDVDLSVTRGRFDWSAESTVLQNNYTMLVADDRVAWLFDPTHSAHFDRDGCAVELVTSITSDGAPLRALSVREIGPAVASIELAGVGATGPRVTARCVADTPALHLFVTERSTLRLHLDPVPRYHAREQGNVTVLAPVAAGWPTLSLRASGGVRSRLDSDDLVLDCDAGQSIQLAVKAQPPDVAGVDMPVLARRIGASEFVVDDVGVDQIVAAIPAAGPIYVNVDGWWRFTAGQPSGDVELIAITTQAGKATGICTDGWVKSSYRAGWGSQYQVAIADLDDRAFRARVLSTTPFTFAPRVELSEPFTSATMDGRPWAYHDGRHVFLPNELGDYEVRLGHSPDLITLARTGALVEECEAGPSYLRLKLREPTWSRIPLAAAGMTALVRVAAGYSIRTIVGARLTRPTPNGAVLTLTSTEVEVSIGRT